MLLKDNAVINHRALPDQNIQKRLESAVIETFSRGDFHEASMRKIAKKAGVSFGTIYKYYNDKNNLLFAFIDMWFDELVDRLVDHLQGISETKEKLRKIFWIQLDYFERNADIGKIIWITVPLKTWMTHETYKQNRLMDIIINVLREGQTIGIFNPDVRPGLLLNFIIPLINRSFNEWVYRGQKESLTSEADMIFELILRAISNPKYQSS
ncbi:MAG: TetR/AcrR family transcriptional regulator [Deltaproteobacteria bacterium]|nr:TetR/AcrR family transcriptional regulator [Deltaproteobacteria bacterium]